MIALYIIAAFIIGVAAGIALKDGREPAYGYNPEPKGGVHPPKTPPPGPPPKYARSGAVPFTEGTVRKGGVNDEPSTPRPANPPKGQRPSGVAI